MISDVFLQAARAPAVLVAPTGATPFPGIDAILARPTPGGAPFPISAEAVTPLKRTDYTGGFPTGSRALVAETLPPTGQAYATNPRKDGTTPIIPASLDVGTTSQSSDTRSAAFINNMNLAARARASTSGNDTGRSQLNPAASAPVDTSPSDSFHWAALIVIAGIAWFVLRR